VSEGDRAKAAADAAQKLAAGTGAFDVTCCGVVHGDTK